MSAHTTLGEMMYAFLATHDTRDSELLELDVDDLSDTPTLKAALDGPERDKWAAAIQKELCNIQDENVYDLVDPSKEQIDNLLGNKLILCCK